MRQVVQNTIRHHVWDEWASEELYKVSLMKDDAMGLLNAGIEELGAWSADWSHFTISISEATNELQPVIDNTGSASFLFSYLRMHTPFRRSVDIHWLVRLLSLVSQLHRGPR
jgi:hypothetical protein